jgi:NADP-dependent 3-hydroxy acid dehydrogenase YdfG
MRKNIVITGASSGLGAQMAREFAARGRNLALCARRIDRLQELRDELTSRYPNSTVLIRQLDVTDHADVFAAFDQFAADLGSLDRVIVNAGIGDGQPLGTGHFDANLRIAQTNFVGVLAQCEAALTVFRAQDSGHLVVVSSIGAFRGLPRSVTTYAATKAGVANLAEGIRADVLDRPITVTTLYPGLISSEMNPDPSVSRLIVDTATGVRAMVRAIEHEVANACVPPWPWRPLGVVLRVLPLRIVSKFI